MKIPSAIGMLAASCLLSLGIFYTANYINNQKAELANRRDNSGEIALVNDFYYPRLFGKTKDGFSPDISKCGFELYKENAGRQIATLDELLLRFEPSQNSGAKENRQDYVDRNAVMVYSSGSLGIGSVTGVRIASDYVISVGHLVRKIYLGDALDLLPDAMKQKIPEFKSIKEEEAIIDTSTMYFASAGGLLYPVNRIVFDSEADIALLHLAVDNSYPFAGLYFRASESMQVGDRVSVSGFHKNGAPYKDTGKITALAAKNNRLAADIKPFGGLSGAPITDSEGNIIGLLHGADLPEGKENKLENYRGSFESKIEYLKALMEAEKRVLECHAK